MADGDKSLSRLYLPFLVVGLYLVIMPYLRDLAGTLPASPGNRDWRYGAMGFFLNAGILPVLGFAVLTIATALNQRAFALKVTGAGALAVAAATVVGYALFRRDHSQLLGSATESSLLLYRMAYLKTTAIVALSAPALFVVGFGAMGLGRGLARSASDSG